MIVKNLLAVGVIATAATAASAADEAKANWKVNGKIRMDAVQSMTETKPDGGEKSTSKMSEIVIKRAQFTLTGETATDTMFIKYLAESNTLDQATITHKFTDMVKVNFGLMPVLALSWENDYSSTDQYLVSWAGQMTPGSSAAGGQADLNFGDHNVSLQVVQGVSTVTGPNPVTGKEGTETYNKGGSLTAALQYRGEINKMIRPLVTYTSEKTSGSKSAALTSGTSTYSRGNGYRTHMGLGVQVETSGLIADVEYDTVKTHKLKYMGEGTDPAEKTNKDADVSSIVLQAKYSIGATTPFLKIASNSSKYGQEEGAGDATGMDMALGVEHKLDSVCRIHAVYSNQSSSKKNEQAPSTKTKSTTSGFNFGVTAAM